ncbi:MAG: HAMP domain-containing sensor histidine kinase [Acidobacteriota bacterium]
MKLRTRIALTTFAVTLPLVAALAMIDTVARRKAAEAELADLVLARLEAPGEQQRCEANPGTWSAGRPRFRPGGPPGFGPPRADRAPQAHRKPMELFAYGETLDADPPAPSLDPSLGTGLEPEGIAVAPASWVRGEVAILVRTPWARGRCAFILARGTSEPWLGAIVPPFRVWLLPGLVIFVALLVAVAPTLRRLAHLTAAVERSASSEYRTGVPIDSDDEIGKLAAAFDEAAREARTQLDEKDRREQALREFLANATHDVMIPLTVLQGHLAQAQAQVAAGEPVSRSLLAEAQNEAHYLGGLMHDLATTARLDSAEPRLQIERVDLEALVARVMARHRPIARELEVEIESATPAEPLTAFADLTLLEQAVSNLVYNAICHNRPGGHAALILEEDRSRFRLRVIDDGPGIPEEELARLLARGFRGNEARTRLPGGQGLGLDIAHRVAKLHDFALVLRRSEYGGLEAELTGRLVS